MKTKTIVENGFKETEIGLIPEDWQVKGFEECIDKERISRDIKIPQGKYKKVGRYPIVDQGASFIAGYTDDKSKLYSGCLPVIVFGDHTRIFKFVDFSFSLGADGTKLIQPKDFLNPKYFYYYLCSLTIESKGYNRHYKYLKEKFIAFPEKPEQQKIAFVLSKIQQAIEQQDRVIETTRELKKSLMNKLFAEGLHGEEQKETEIGLVPKSWEVVKFGELADFKNGINFGIKQKGNKGILTIDVFNMYGENIFVKLDNLYRVNIDLSDKPSYILKDGDILFVRSSLKSEGVGWTTLFKSGSEPITFCGFIIRARLRQDSCLATYLIYFFRSDLARRKLISSERVAITNINQGILLSFLVPIPGMQEQEKIVATLQTIDKKLTQAESRKQTLQALFRTMLNQLMTGKVRVKDFDFEVN